MRCWTRAAEDRARLGDRRFDDYALESFYSSGLPW
jgi:hypothetical protein